MLAWLEDGSGLAAGTDFHLGYSPERNDPGNRTWTLATTPKIVSGIDGDSLAAVEEFYQGIVDRTVAVSSPREAELAKLIQNTFRHVNIALMNELSAHTAAAPAWSSSPGTASPATSWSKARPHPTPVP